MSVEKEPVATTEKPDVVQQQERNFRALAKRNESLERENKTLMEKFTSLEQQITKLSQNNTSQTSSTPYQKYGLEPGGLVESDRLIDILRKEREELRNEMRREAEEVAYGAFEKQKRASFQERLLDKYPDYNQVVNEETYYLLKDDNEELFESIQEVPDEYKRRELAYKAIKKLKDKKNKAAHSSQEIVNQNSRSNYYYTPAGSTGGQAQNFNWKDFHSSPEARAKAYEQLKANQRNMRIE